MKGTDSFKKVIEAHLQKMAEADQVFAAKLQNEKKNIDGCITYILNTVKKSGCNGFADEEIFGMAVHYYDEENVEVGKPVNCQVVVNRVPELTEEEKKQAKQAAIDKVIAEEKERILKRATKKAEQPKEVIQQSLF
jgi:ribosome-associated translation inhibitor RaiA